MTDHLDEAATKAIELAEKLADQQWERDEWTTLAVRAAQHLTYMAGLVRGGAVRAIPSREVLRGRFSANIRRTPIAFEDADPGDLDPVETAADEQESKARVEVDGDGTIRGFDRAGEQVFPPAEYEALHDQLDLCKRNAQVQRDELLAQRDELMRAANAVVNKPVIQDDDIVHLAKVVVRIEKD
jgi:hypothetical protein